MYCEKCDVEMNGLYTRTPQKPPNVEKNSMNSYRIRLGWHCCSCGKVHIVDDYFSGLSWWDTEKSPLRVARKENQTEERQQKLEEWAKKQK